MTKVTHLYEDLCHLLYWIYLFQNPSKQTQIHSQINRNKSLVLKTCVEETRRWSLSVSLIGVWSFIHSLCYEYKSTPYNLEILIQGTHSVLLLMYRIVFFFQVIFSIINIFLTTEFFSKMPGLC